VLLAAVLNTRIFNEEIMSWNVDSDLRSRHWEGTWMTCVTGTIVGGSEPFQGRVLIAHDWLVKWGGAERVLDELLALFPDADIVTAFRHEAVALEQPTAYHASELWAGKLPGARNHHHWFLPIEALAFFGLNSANYDVVISSSHAFSKATRSGRLGINLCYCYSPLRYAWDLYDTYLSRSPFHRRLALRLGRRVFQLADRAAARRVSHFVAISQFVARRIQTCYGRVARVVYPPVRRKVQHLTASRRRDSFLLYLGRLVPYKRVDLLIEASKRLNMRLVIAGDGHDRPRLEQLAGPRVEFLGAVSEDDAAELLASCGCFVFAAEEDFGMAPIEANSFGTPVVAYRGGAVTETMISGVTAELFDEPTVSSAAEAIRRALGRSWDEALLARNADRFSVERFRSEFRATFQSTLAGDRW
jgi:glycosyltransferase involved in cell wall biosynthesis